jgi:hypothetical protein
MCVRKHVRGGEGPGDKKEREKRKRKKKTKTGVRRQEIGHRLCDAWGHWGERALHDDDTLSKQPKKKINPAA